MAELVDAVPARALAVYAHPDDAEISCGGTLATWAGAGSEVHVLVCTLGDKGSTDPDVDGGDLASRRREESEAAAAVLGVAATHRLGVPDGDLVADNETCGRIVEVVRRVRPDVVVCPDPTALLFGDRYWNHRDHRAAGTATLDAVAPAAANPHYFPGAGGDPHQVRDVYLSGTLDPNVWIDVSDAIERKIDALFCHRSQLSDTSEYFRGFLRERAEDAGRAAGVRYAEGFRRVALA
ncbi:MAG TPA: PIG-L family deacetylase [Acidimicrobiales bacterium]|jgi:LmbE family N-acetylglucosaminyl deacetylase|nr:PIG-L family deacetylase [Acidimicrobiales bacterium]